MMNMNLFSSGKVEETFEQAKGSKSIRLAYKWYNCTRCVN